MLFSCVVYRICNASSDFAQNQNLSNEEEEEDQLYKWIELKVKGHDNAVLDSYQTFVSSAAKELDIKFEIL